MNVSLTPDVERFVAEKVRAGEYQSVDEAVNELLARLKEQERHGGNGGVRRTSAGFPVFSVPAGTRQITSEDVRRAEDET